MTDKELFIQQIERDYIVCHMADCPIGEQCLRLKVGKHIPSNRVFCVSVNPYHDNVATERCPLYRPASKVRCAKGMTQIFTDDMPKRVEQWVRAALIARYNRTYFFEYRNGTRLIPPAMQDEVRDLFRQAGWTGEVNFDGYVETYDW